MVYDYLLALQAGNSLKMRQYAGDQARILFKNCAVFNA
jgi:hypothetical protein